MVEQLPASKERMVSTEICSTVIKYTQNGSLAKHAIKGNLNKYWGEKDKLSVVDDLLLYGMRVVIPESLQCEILMKIHHGNQGIKDVGFEFLPRCGGQGYLSKLRILSQGVQRA